MIIGKAIDNFKKKNPRKPFILATFGKQLLAVSWWLFELAVLEKRFRKLVVSKKFW